MKLKSQITIVDLNDRGIRSVTTYYLVTSASSGVTRNTSGWTTAVQSVTPTDKYLWIYDRTEYTDDTVEYTEPRISGVYGEQGTAGKDGKDGINGKDGVDGRTSYFHIKYSDVASPTAASQMNETGGDYIGTYVDFAEADSTDPSKYTWVKTKGAQGATGAQGIAGKNGVDGKTSYLHIAYATSADGRTGFDVANSTGKTYIGTYTDFTQADSTDPTKYTWSLIKGEKGDRGAQGLQGIQGPQGEQGIAGPKGNDGHPAEFYRLKGVTEKAVVGGDGKLTANLSYQIEHVTGADIAVRYSAADGYRIRYRGDTGTPANTLMSYGSTSSAVYVLENYSHVSHPDSIIVELLGPDGYVLDRRTVPVMFSTSAALDVNGRVGEISARVQGMAVGGRNLLRATAFEPADWADVTERMIPPGSIDTEITHGGHNSVRVQMSGAAGDTYQGAKWTAVEVESGAQYVASVWAYTPDVEGIDHGAYIELKYKDAGGASQRIGFESMVPSVSGVWERFSTVFTVPAGVRVTECNFWLTRNGSLYLAEPMIERGNLLTDWMPAPEDAEAYLAEVNLSIGKVDTSVTDLKTGLEASGVHLDTNGITLKGDTKIIDSDGHETALFENGRITAEHINADNIEANGVKINGTVTAEDGMVGPFTICGSEGTTLPDGTRDSNALIAQGLGWNGAANQQMKLALTLIAFTDSLRNKSIKLGNATISAVAGIGDALLYINSPYTVNSPDYSIDTFDAAVAISKGCVAGLRRRTVRVASSTILNWTFNNIICYNTAEIRLYLPDEPEDGQDYFIRLRNNYKVNIIPAAGQKLNITGNFAGSEATNITLPYNMNFITGSQTITTAYLLYDGYDKRWYCQFLI